MYIYIYIERERERLIALVPMKPVPKLPLACAAEIYAQ